MPLKGSQLSVSSDWWVLLVKLKLNSENLSPLFQCLCTWSSHMRARLPVGHRSSPLPLLRKHYIPVVSFFDCMLELRTKGPSYIPAGWQPHLQRWNPSLQTRNGGCRTPGPGCRLLVSAASLSAGLGCYGTTNNTWWVELVHELLLLMWSSLKQAHITGILTCTATKEVPVM